MGIAIVVLTLLTAGICALVLFFPTASDDSPVSTPAASVETFDFYLLCTFESDDRQAAYDNALVTAARGGAGYVYNDGKYRVVAAVYRKKEDAEALSEVNDGSFCVKLEIRFSAKNKAQKNAVAYLAGEWFDDISRASTGLERGSITDAQAERSAIAACNKLLRYADEIKSGAVYRTLVEAGEYSVPTSRELKSYLRYVAARAVVLAASFD